jgi:hypothetical protein
MIAREDVLVAGLFDSQKAVEATLEKLHQIGVSDADVEVGAPEPGRYRIERHESSDMWKAVRKGMYFGAVIGAVVSMGIMSFVVRGLSLPGLIELGLPMGVAWGIFFGGLTGMALKAVTLVPGEPRYAITEDNHDVLLVVHAGDRVGAAHEVMEHQHPRYLLTDVPAIHHGQGHLVASA